MKDSDLINISYTSKDFNSIYSELLDLVKKLTNKWDPSLSNESDPGVLLLKLNQVDFGITYKQKYVNALCELLIHTNKEFINKLFKFLIFFHNF